MNGNVTSQNGWTYDAIGNRLTQTLNGADMHGYSYEKNGTNPLNGQRLSNIVIGGPSYTYAYDANGNTTTASTYTTYGWDNWDRLTSMTSSGTTFSFDYDAQGRRIKSSHMGTKFIYRGLDPVSMTYTSSGLYTWSDYLFAPGIDEPLARAVGPNDISYFSVDGLGSVVLLTNHPDGSVKNKYDYKAWGESSVSVVSAHQPFVFTGRELAVPQLPAGQPYYYRARYYSPDIGRFLSEDPIPLSDRTLREQNHYAYVASSPAMFLDPTGMKIWVCCRKTRLTPFGGPGNHCYFWDDRPRVSAYAKCCARGSSRACSETGPGAGWGDACTPIEGSDGKEDAVISCCKRTSDKWPFFPPVNDCLEGLNDCLKAASLATFPEKRFGKPKPCCAKP